MNKLLEILKELLNQIPLPAGIVIIVIVIIIVALLTNFKNLKEIFKSLYTTFKEFQDYKKMSKTIGDLRNDIVQKAKKLKDEINKIEQAIQQLQNAMQTLNNHSPLQQLLQEEEEESGRAAVKTINEEIKNLSDYLENLRNISKASNDIMDLAMQKTDPSQRAEGMARRRKKRSQDNQTKN